MARNLSSGPAQEGVVNELLAQLGGYIPQPGRRQGGQFRSQAEIADLVRARIGTQGTGLRNPFPTVAPGTALPAGAPTPLALPQGGPRAYTVGPMHGPSGPTPLALPAGSAAGAGSAGPAAAASQGGLRQSLLSQMRPGQWLNRPMNNPMAAGLANRIPGGAGMLRGGLYGMAGNLGGGMLEGAFDSQDMGMAGDIVGSAARFAPLGSVFGLPGMAVAGGVGGIWGALTGDRGGDQRSAQEKLTEELGGLVPEDQLTRAGALYNALEGTLGEEAAFQTAYGQLINDLAMGQTAEPAPDVLALQMATQAMMQPIVAQSNQRLADFQAQMGQIIPTLPEAYQSAYAAAVPEAAMWQGMMIDANQMAAQMAPIAEAIRQQQTTGGTNSYASALAQDDLLSQFMGG